MHVNTYVHLDKDKDFNVVVKSSIVESLFSYSYHVIDINGSNGQINLYLTVDQMVKLHQELGLGINRAEEVERKLQQEKSEEEVNG